MVSNSDNMILEITHNDTTIHRNAIDTSFEFFIAKFCQVGVQSCSESNFRSNDAIISNFLENPRHIEHTLFAVNFFPVNHIDKNIPLTVSNFSIKSIQTFEDESLLCSIRNLVFVGSFALMEERIFHSFVKIVDSNGTSFLFSTACQKP